MFLWDRIAYPPRDSAVADPWVALSAIASATDTVRLGPMVTPLARRRVQKLARETVTLDHLSNGRLTLGVGLGNADDLEPFGEAVDPRERGAPAGRGPGPARRVLAWGIPAPLPLQRPRIPVWVAAELAQPAADPTRRSDGTGCSRSTSPDRKQLAELAEEIRRARAGSDAPFDLVVEVPPGADVRRWEAAGATWVLTSMEPQPAEREVRDVVDAGP